MKTNNEKIKIKATKTTFFLLNSNNSNFAKSKEMKAGFLNSPTTCSMN